MKKYQVSESYDNAPVSEVEADSPMSALRMQCSPEVSLWMQGWDNNVFYAVAIYPDPPPPIDADQIPQDRTPQPRYFTIKELV